jgi:hypothetical protein
VKEEWRPVVGHEGAYEVSDQGRVRSLDHFRMQTGPHGELVQRFYPGKILRPSVSTKAGHVGVSLRRKTFHVHALVLAAFVGPRPVGQETLHLNHVGADNRLVNLRYGTRSENSRMTYAPGGPGARTHCKRGHAFGPDNVQPYMAKIGVRTCRKCQHIWLAARRAAKKAAQV